MNEPQWEVTLAAALCAANGGGPDVQPNDAGFSWVTMAINSLNDTLDVPSSWQMTEDLPAQSGASTSSFGVLGAAPGSAAWASVTRPLTQAAQMSLALVAHPDSWDIVSMTGGADDGSVESTFAGALERFYDNPLTFISASPAPWSVTNRSQCPDSQSVWTNLQMARSEIQANLRGIVTVATSTAPGVRVVDVDYPYIVDKSNVCFPSSKDVHGIGSVIDDFATIHASVTGKNVLHVDLRKSLAANGFGSSPITAGLIQLSRLYGYPHPSQLGQGVIAAQALEVIEVLQ